MPDGDLYNRNVGRRSQKAARYFHEFGDPDSAIREGMRLLEKCLVDRGTDEILRIVRVGVEDEWSPWVRAELERVRRLADSAIVQIAVQRAMLHQMDPDLLKGNLSADSVPDVVRSELLKDILIAFIEAEVSPRQLQAAFNQLSPEDREKRRNRCRSTLDALRRSPVLDIFVQKLLLLGAEGAEDKVKVPRPSVQKPSQEELVHTALPL